MDEIPPFFPPIDPRDQLPNEPYITSPVEREDVAEILRDAEYQRSLAHQKIAENIDGELIGIESELKSAQATVYGSIDNQLDDAERVFHKVSNKINEDINRSLTESYQLGMGLGIPVPIDDAIALAKETGEYLASNYLTAEDFAPVKVEVPDSIPKITPIVIPESPTFVRIDPSIPDPSTNLDMCGNQPKPLAFSYLGTPIDWDVASRLIDPWTIYDTSTSEKTVFFQPLIPGVNSQIVYLILNGTLVKFGSTQSQLMPMPGPQPPGKWASYRQYATIPIPKCPGSTPPPPPTPDPVPSPGPAPVEASCPVTSDPSDCEVEQSTKLFGKTYDKLTELERVTVKSVCIQLEQCKVEKRREEDKNPSTTPDMSFSFVPPQWCDKDIAEQMRVWSDRVKDPIGIFKSMLSIEKSPKGGYYVPPWLEWMRDVDLIPWWVKDLICGILDASITGVGTATELFAKIAGDKSAVALSADVVYAIAEFLHDWIGFPPGSWLRRLEKTVNYFGPENIPSTSEAMEGLLSGVFDEDRAFAYVAANNDCPGPIRELIHGRRTRPNVNEIIDLWFREKIDDKEFERRLKEVGVLEQDDAQKFVDLKEALPGVADIIRFMVRDVADESVVSGYGLDDEFAEKWKGLLAKYGSAQGIKLDLARYFWRAHWEFPSPTQLYEMLHRLRPGRVDPSIEVDAKLVEKTLGINDYAPIWRKRLMAVSYSPLTRTDAQRAFAIGAIDDKELKSTFMDEGYNDENATILVRFTKRLVDRQRRAAAGIPGPKDFIRQYVNGTISRRELRNRLEDFGWEASTVADALKGAAAKRDSRRHEAHIERIRVGYLRREIDTQVATRELSAVGLEPIDISYLLDLWSTKLASKAKLPQAAQLCRAYGRGLISFDEYTKKLIQLGYTPQDVETISGLCAEEWDEKTLKKLRAELEKAQKKQESQKKEQQKRQEKEAKERQKEIERERKEAEKKRKEEESERGKQDRKEKEYWNQKRKWERENPGYIYPGTIDDNYYGPPDESMRDPNFEEEIEA